MTSRWERIARKGHGRERKRMLFFIFGFMFDRLKYFSQEFVFFIKFEFQFSSVLSVICVVE